MQISSISSVTLKSDAYDEINDAYARSSLIVIALCTASICVIRRRLGTL